MENKSVFGSWDNMWNYMYPSIALVIDHLQGVVLIVLGQCEHGHVTGLFEFIDLAKISRLKSLDDELRSLTA